MPFDVVVAAAAVGNIATVAVVSEAAAAAAGSTAGIAVAAGKVAVGSELRSRTASVKAAYAAGLLRIVVAAYRMAGSLHTGWLSRLRNSHTENSSAVAGAADFAAAAEEPTSIGWGA